MQRHLYRLIACFLIFIAAILVFGRNMKEKKHEDKEITQLSEVSFPIVYANAGKYKVNPLHGHTNALKLSTLRDSMMYLESNGVLKFELEEKKLKVKSIEFNLKEIYTEKVLQTGKVEDYDKEKNTFSVKIGKGLKEDGEYALEIILTSDKDKKVTYYTRVKNILPGHMKEIIDFAYEFHNNTIDKSKAESVVSYIEPNGKMSTTDLSYVNINSNLNMISFANLAPEVVSDIYTYIREISDDTAVVELVYYAQAEAGDGKEIYEVCEGYRIRYTDTRMYLLYYDRTMESVFDIDKVSVSTNQIKYGITSDTEIDAIANKAGDKLCFVRNRELWYYNKTEDKIVKVFSFKEKETDYISDIYDQHNVKILNMSEDGNAYFMVYGYMNRGEYEGRTAIVLYKYFVDQNRIEEMAYIPVDVSFNVLNQQVTDFAYVNDSEIFFFAVAGNIYEYNVTTGSITVLASNVSEDDMVMSKEGGYIAWQSTNENGAYTSINMRKFSTMKTYSIDADEGKGIKILEVIGENIVYGYSSSEKKQEMVDGTTILPINKVVIADVAGNVIKEYPQAGCFVTNAFVEGNKITLKRVKKDNSGIYYDVDDECIFGNKNENARVFELTQRATEKTLTDWYLKLPSGVSFKDGYKIAGSDYTDVKYDTNVEVFKDTIQEKCYYVYSYHGLDSAYDNAADAIVRANDRMGTVYDNEGYKVWERGITNSWVSLENVKTVDSSKSISACIAMLLENSGKSVSVDTIEKETGSIVEKIDKHIDGAAVDLTGTELNYIKYFVNDNRPVMVLTSANKAVVIVGYTDESLTYYDPAAGGKNKVSIAKAKEMFATVGNVYVGYMQ